jgi:hypothetical protein
MDKSNEIKLVSSEGGLPLGDVASCSAMEGGLPMVFVALQMDKLLLYSYN